MDLYLANKFFIVTGAGSGFGRAIAEKLLQEGAEVLAIARTDQVMNDFKRDHPEKLQILTGDITRLDIQQEILHISSQKRPDGLIVNAAGPAAGAFLEMDINSWDEAYQQVLRWKVTLIQQMMPVFIKNNYGRIVFIESVSVKQPVENLVLSNSLRLAVVGFVKSLAQEVASENITLNILAPGYHNTSAMQRLFLKKSALTGMSEQEAKEEFIKQIPMGKMGEATDMASLAVWLLSPHARYVTGQTISHDGGLVSGIFG